MSKINWKNMISASKVRNYILKDPFLDWITEFNVVSINQKLRKKNDDYNTRFSNRSKVDDYNNFIMNEGIIFEKYIFNILKNKYQCVKVCESSESCNVENFNKTIQCMKNGYEIIYQGVLHDYENNLYGSPDLMVRSDRFNEIFNTNIIDNKKSPKLNLDYHYIIVDIKHSTINLAANNINIINTGSVPAYKGQIYIYNKILSSVQGYEPRYGFVYGKQYNYYNKFYSHEQRIGVIDYLDYDKKFIDIVNDAIDWINNMRNNGHTWKLLPTPSVKELYPNMKNKNDRSNMKRKYSEEIGEITSVMYCSPKHRNNCLNNGIISWKDKNCNSKVLGFKPSKRAKLIDNILNINRGKRLINLYDIQKNWDNFSKNQIEMFLDFETINMDGHENKMFMIGVGYELDNKWIYKSFIMNKLNNKSELENVNKFLTFIKDIEKKYKKECVFIHWTQFEPNILNKFLKKNKINKKLNYFDLYQMYIDNNIVVNGSLNFSLKNVAKAMHKHNMIDTIWDENNSCNNGLNAMLYAYKLYNENNIITGNEELMKKIIEYNEVDCKVMYEMIKFLRTFSF
jgi:uncharacterized protein YprB with RNaseH-like and TPR domain